MFLNFLLIYAEFKLKFLLWNSANNQLGMGLRASSQNTKQRQHERRGFNDSQQIEKWWYPFNTINVAFYVTEYHDDMPEL